MSLFDILIGGASGQRLSSHVRTAVDLGGRTFEAWVATTPSCADQPPVQATFLVAQ